MDPVADIQYMKFVFSIGQGALHSSVVCGFLSSDREKLWHGSSPGNRRSKCGRGGANDGITGSYNMLNFKSSSNHTFDVQSLTVIPVRASTLCRMSSFSCLKRFLGFGL